MHEDAEFRQRGWVTSYQHPFVGKLNQIGLLFDFSEPGRVQGPPLVVGQHSREILAELGYSPEQIEAMCKECVLSWSLTEGHRKVRSPWQPQAAARRCGGEEIMSTNETTPAAPTRPDPVFTPDAIFFWREPLVVSSWASAARTARRSFPAAADVPGLPQHQAETVKLSGAARLPAG